MTEAIKEQVEQLIRAGERGKAVEFLQLTFNITEREANLLVEALEREIVIEADVADTEATPALEREVSDMLRSGRRTEALKHIRQHRNVSLREALVILGEMAREATPNQVSFNLAGCLQFVAKGIGIFFIVNSVLLLVGAAIVYFVQENTISNSDRVPGLIREMKSDHTGAMAPVVDFEWHGKRRSYESGYYSSTPDHAAGEQVFVFVNRDDPEEVSLDTFMDRWAMIVGLSVPGAFLLALGNVLLYFGRKKF